MYQLRNLARLVLQDSVDTRMARLTALGPPPSPPPPPLPVELCSGGSSGLAVAMGGGEGSVAVGMQQQQGGGGWILRRLSPRECLRYSQLSTLLSQQQHGRGGGQGPGQQEQEGHEQEHVLPHGLGQQQEQQQGPPSELREAASVCASAAGAPSSPTHTPQHKHPRPDRPASNTPPASPSPRKPQQQEAGGATCCAEEGGEPDPVARLLSPASLPGAELLHVLYAVAVMQQDALGCLLGRMSPLAAMMLTSRFEQVSGGAGGQGLAAMMLSR